MNDEKNRDVPDEESDATRRVDRTNHPPRRRSLEGDIVDVVEGIDYEQIVEGSAKQVMDSGIR